MCHCIRIMVLGAVLSAVSASPALAQAYISPLVGFDFGGDSGCQTASSCEDRASNLGVALGTSSFIGFEEEFAYARHFFGKDPAQNTNVFTAMSNLLVSPRIGPVRPYGLIGIGIIKTQVKATLADLATSDTSTAWDIGGGLEVGGDHVGIRGDLRYFHALKDVPLPFFPVKDLQLDYGRAAVGLVLRF